VARTQAIQKESVAHAPARKERVAVIIPVYNEERIIGQVVDAIPREHVDAVICVDDGSTDRTPEILAEREIEVVRHEKKYYTGAAIRDGIHHARKLGMDVAVIMAGNGKDDPAQIPEVMAPVLYEGFDYVQGSRYLEGGDSSWDTLPRHRKFATRLYPFLLRLVTGFPATEGTNGFRAYKLSIFDDPKIDIDQRWLDENLEYYIGLRVLQRGFKVKEVPVKKIYPNTKKYDEYTKIRPGIGWLIRLKPLFFLGLRLRN